MTALSLALAQKIIDAALAPSKAQSYKPMGIARAKAWGAVGASGGRCDEDEAICIADIQAVCLIAG